MSKKIVFDVILHNPHLVKTLIQCKKKQSPRDSLNRGFSVYNNIFGNSIANSFKRLFSRCGIFNKMPRIPELHLLCKYLETRAIAKRNLGLESKTFEFTVADSSDTLCILMPFLALKH
jgi:hypothetical protein